MVHNKPRLLIDWSEEDGDVLWWKFPVQEAPYVGSPLNLGFPVMVDLIGPKGKTLGSITKQVGGWPGYHTHWTPLPATPKEPK